ncbi:MAG: hypothetical protein PVJ21_19320 [Anaerolineales bacterium]|jgi:hypothetical protein
MKQKLLAITLVFFLAFGITTSAFAQDYYFTVEQETVHAYWNDDGTLSLDYTLVFGNQQGAHVIDFVDMGMPNNSFDMNTVSADVNGTPVSVDRGEYQGSGSGFAVVMGGQAISPGSRGTVHVRVGRINNVLFTDSEDETYASAVFSPTWFGSQYVAGSTDVTVVFHLPPGVGPDEPKWHSAPSGFPSEPETALDSNGRVTYTWNNPNGNAHTQYEFGASFPKTYVPDSAIQTEPVFTFPSINFDALINLGCCAFFAFMFFGMPVLGIINSRRRKLKYLPPKIAIEGHGIKRGLTAVEAAILMEQPLDKVMTMILFGVVKKDAAEVESRDPLKLKITDPLPEGLHEYEKQFLQAFRPEANLKQRREDLQDMTIKLVKSISQKMKGFSRKETVAYYKNIMERAWAQIAAADTPEVQSKLFDEAMEWTMLDKDYDERTRRTFTGPVFVPMWWGRYDPGYGRSVGGSRPVSVGGSTPSSRSGGLPGSAFAASVVGGVQNFSQKVIGNVNDFTGRVTNKTNPVPKSSSSGRSGGGGCACACACAGCACACAGGGR